jgi:hypothetical protein
MITPEAASLALEADARTGDLSISVRYGRGLKIVSAEVRRSLNKTMI